MNVPGGSTCTFPASSIPGGEKRHWTFAETQFGPEPQPLMELLAERSCAGHHLRERGHAGRGCGGNAANVPRSAESAKNFVFLSSFLPKPLAKRQADWVK